MLANQDNPYIFGNPDNDRRRLDTMAQLIARFVRDHAREFAAGEVHSILDVGSGEGQLGFALQDAWPGASLTGVERDPLAVSKANQAAARDKRAAHFVEGDVQLDLPPGPYDLVLMSLILAHTQRPQAVLERAYEVMRPGATLWIMDASELMAGDGTDSASDQLFQLLIDTMQKIGVHPNIIDELPELMKQAGFTAYTRHDTDSDHPLASHNRDERMQVNAAALGAIYAARPLIARVQGIPISRLDALFVELTNDLMSSQEVSSRRFFAVVIAKKPG